MLGLLGTEENLPETNPAPDFVLLLNPDTEVENDALGQLVGALVENPTAGASGAHLSYGDGAFQHGAFTFPTLAQILIDFFPMTVEYRERPTPPARFPVAFSSVRHARRPRRSSAAA